MYNNSALPKFVPSHFHPKSIQFLPPISRKRPIGHSTASSSTSSISSASSTNSGSSSSLECFVMPPTPNRPICAQSKLRRPEVAKNRWIFTKQQLLEVPTIKQGILAEEELRNRRKAADFIRAMVEQLNWNLPGTRAKITQVCMCTAMFHFHRFFALHSMKEFEALDIAAACLMLAGKWEECPRKLESVVKAWLFLQNQEEEEEKENAPSSSERLELEAEAYNAAHKYFVFLEGVILQTMGFDLQVSLPHSIVLNRMQKCGISQQKMAYDFATDVILNTIWCLRYSLDQLADVCIFVASHQKEDLELKKVIGCVRSQSTLDMDIPSIVLDRPVEERIQE